LLHSNYLFVIGDRLLSLRLIMCRFDKLMSLK
jgi:hypothetical protein